MTAYAALLAVCAAAAAGLVLTPPDPRRVLTRLTPRRPAGPGRARRWRALPQAEVSDRRAMMSDLLDGLAAELRAGAGPAAALAAACAQLPGLAELSQAAARPGGDVPGSLARLGGQPGGAAAADLAVAWRVCEVTGCSLAGPVERLLAAHRAQEEVRRELSAQLAGPRATAYLLSGLPLAGVAMGIALGADPVGFLTGTAVGAVCLGAGLGLLLLGARWTRALAASVTDGWADP